MSCLKGKIYISHTLKIKFL